MLENLTFELLSLTALLDTPLRSLPSVALRIGWLDDGDGIGLQIGPVTVWLGSGVEGAGALG